MIVGMYARDWWMHRCIRNLLREAVCASCGYRLFGLPVHDDDGKRVVGCPECGSKTVLNEGHITEADINPALLTDS